MSKNIYLIGFMGVGKSTVGRLLSQKMQGRLVEMDETIEAEQQTTIKEIFEKYGEKYFRDLESALIESTKNQDNLIVSCGGGAVLRPENVQAMRQGSRIVYLKASPESIYKRVRHSTKRPLLNGNMNVEYIAELMEQRQAVYEAAADVTISTDGKRVTEIVEEILSNLV